MKQSEAMKKLQKITGTNYVYFSVAVDKKKYKEQVYTECRLYASKELSDESYIATGKTFEECLIKIENEIKNKIEEDQDDREKGISLEEAESK